MNGRLLVKILAHDTFQLGGDMDYFYSPSVRGFFCDAVNGRDIPEDSIRITSSEHRSLLDGQALGLLIAVNDAGVVVSVAAPDTSGVRAWRAYQAQAQAELIASDRVAMRCMKAGVPYPGDWLFRDELLRAIVRADSGDSTASIPNRPAFPPGT
jgi:hypothetical protein